MERTREILPVFIAGQLFDYLEIGSIERMTAQSRIEYLRLTREQIKCITMGSISRTGVFLDALKYVQFNLSFGSLLCVFDNSERCYRAYFFKDILLN